MLSKSATNADVDCTEEAQTLPPALSSSHLGRPRVLTCERQKRDSRPHPTPLPRWTFELVDFLRPLPVLFSTPRASSLARLPSHTSSRVPGSFAEPEDFAWVQGRTGSGSVLGTCPKLLPQHFACRIGFYCIALMGSHAALNPKYTAL